MSRLLHCPNSGPHFTPYRTYTTVAFLYREKNSAPMVMLYCENFYFSPVRHTWPSIIFLPVPVILCATSTKFTLFSNSMCGWSNFLLAIRATFVTCGFFLLPVRTRFMLSYIFAAFTQNFSYFFQCLNTNVKLFILSYTINMVTRISRTFI